MKKLLAYIAVAVLICSGATVIYTSTHKPLDEELIPPAKLQELMASRRLAQQELSYTGDDTLSSKIVDAIIMRPEIVAVVRVKEMHSAVSRYGSALKLTLAVEKTLRGAPPKTFKTQCYWNDSLIPKVAPIGYQRFGLVRGKRMLGAFGLSKQAGLEPSTQEDSWCRGILDLDDPSEAAFLPIAFAALKMETDAITLGTSLYETGLMNESVVIRELAKHRLLHPEKGACDNRAEKPILAEARRLLASQYPKDREEAVEWLGEMSRSGESCQLVQGDFCKAPQFHREPIRELLKIAVEDKNVAIGDRAFEYLARLDFDRHENAGYCAQIIPPLRTVHKYKSRGSSGGHWSSGILSGGSICIGSRK